MPISPGIPLQLPAFTILGDSRDWAGVPVRFDDTDLPIAWLRNNFTTNFSTQVEPYFVGAGGPRLGAVPRAPRSMHVFQFSDGQIENYINSTWLEDADRLGVVAFDAFSAYGFRPLLMPMPASALDTPLTPDQFVGGQLVKEVASTIVDSYIGGTSDPGDVTDWNALTASFDAVLSVVTFDVNGSPYTLTDFQTFAATLGQSVVLSYDSNTETSEDYLHRVIDQAMQFFLDNE